MGFASLALGASALSLGSWWFDRLEGPASRFIAGATLVPLGLLALCVGACALWAWGHERFRERQPLGVPPWPMLLAAQAVSLAVGAVLARRGAAWPFLLVAVMPPVLSGGLAARFALGPAARPPVRFRDLLPALAWGAFVAPVGALAAEVLAALAAAGAVLFGAMVGTQGARAALIATPRALSQTALDRAQVVALGELVIREPAVLVAIAVGMVVVAPAIEEFAKIVGVLLLARDGSRATYAVVLMGLVTGIGFAIVENIAYAAQAGARGWFALSLLRAPTPVMHGAASALVALGWARQLQRPAGWALGWGAVAGIGLHGVWNLGPLLLAGSVLAPRWLMPVAAALGVVLLVAVAIGTPVFLVSLKRALGRETLVGSGGATGAYETVAPVPGPLHVDLVSQTRPSN